MYMFLFVCEGAFYLENCYVCYFTIFNIVKMLRLNNLIEFTAWHSRLF